MELVSIGPVPTPTRATSAGPSPPRRNPMEDADSSVTRKRPRLDSGDRTRRSMSADRIYPTSLELGNARASLPPSRGDSSPKYTGIATASSPADRTPSKVTINVRDPAPNISPTLPVANGTHLSAPSDKDDIKSSSHTESSIRVDSMSSDVISVTSTPTRSPEIEVAEIEDMNQDSGETRWRPLARLIDAKDTQGALLDMFPYGHRQTNLRHTVTLLGNAFEKNSLEDGEILKSLTGWMITYLQATEQHDTQWWEMYLDEREFWDELPAMVEGLFRRSSIRFGASMILPLRNDEDSVGRQYFQEFLVTYTALASRMAQIDCQVLNECAIDANIIPDLISHRYLNNVLILISPNGSTLWKSLHDLCNFDCRPTITAIIHCFTRRPTNGIKCLSQIIKGLLDRSQTTPSLVQKIWTPLHIVNRVTHHYNLLSDSRDEEQIAMLQTMRHVPVEAYNLFQIVDATLQTFVSKKVSVLSLEMSQALVQQLSTLLTNIGIADQELTMSTLGEKLGIHEEFDNGEGVAIMELAWKFQLLKKCILEGRMEIRVQGVETMQQELVNVYNKYVQRTNAHKDHPVAQYLSNFMLDNKLVEYFVGVESHPQLITRCPNIVGFLVITSRYSEAESDAIWKAVVNSPDPRTVDAILNMITGFFNISPYETLLYLTKKLDELPLEAFDSSMIFYSRTLLDNLRRTWKELRLVGRLHLPPYHLCIRLIRQAAAEKSLPLNRTKEIHVFALSELQNLLAFGPSNADRKLIYEECVKDISCRTAFATGSVSAINALLGQNPEGDIRMLASDSDLTNLMIEDFAYIIDAESRSLSLPRTLDEGLTVRLDLLQSIIIHIPDTITADAGQRLWDVILGHKALSDRARHSAWTILVRATRSCLKRNSFIDRCIADYLPQLNPKYMGPGCLSFVGQVTNYESRLAHLQLDEGQQRISPLGGELLWHLALVAPSGGIELDAIQMLVALHLDSPKNLHTAQGVLEAVQIDVVERCIRQLKIAASKLKSFSDGTSSGEDEPMIVVASEEEINVQRMSFTRSLLILKEFVQGVRSRPRYSPIPRKKPHFPKNLHEIKGDSFQIRYQSFSGGTNTGIHSIEIGDLETIDELSQRLVALTGFSKFTAIAGGQKLDLANLSKSTLREMRFDQKGLLIVKKAHDANSLPDLAPAPELRPLELEVMKNFRELYQLLSMEERLAKEVFDFLIAFPPHESITTIVCSKDNSIDLAFPPTIPFKILYSAHTLKNCLVHQLQNVWETFPDGDRNIAKVIQGTTSQGFICHGVHVIATTLITHGVLSDTLDSEVDLSTAAGLVDCLLKFLKEPVSTEVASNFFSNPLAFVKRLQALILSARGISNIEANNLVCNCFAAILEASLHCRSVWDIFRNSNQCPGLFQSLLLTDSRQEIRQGIADSIRGICCTLPTLSTTPTQDFVSYFWDILVAQIPESLKHGETSQQFFDTALSVFRAVDESGRDNLNLTAYTHDWSNLLLRHVHDEFVGRDGIDWIVFGIAGLLQWCIQLTKSLKKPMIIQDDLMENLFRAHLFPKISNSNTNTLIKARVPTLHSQTRQELYSIILALSNDMVGYEKLLRLVRELLPQGEDSHAWSWGIAQILEDYSYEPNWNFERAKSIRSPTGYPGLRNLSNTCYLNSLFTQLFMNVSFRGFMIDSNIADEPSQRLLSETKNLFAFMQDTMLRSVDPQGIADSITTYENTLIDVSVQMDVDEFYNLLFDRWESQILSDVGKKRFRGFYGGQIVQQIKSKECPHISERLEPFSAIQCDIQGKANLIESLNAYVDGEVMEGANKYSCTSCGSYVDAVKRACLKDIPDNLIFHLKRFDFDVMTGMRSKINDKFEFPHVIDMSPYHVDHLKDPDQPNPPDMFELVGILVHSGTTESGHYYSYIRERPAPRSQNPIWIEFNDADVSRFDPAHIPDQCFGGPTDASPFSPVRFAKAWNAYMLFYQRVDAMEAEYEDHISSPLGVPVKIELAVEASNRIAVENELFIRKYCLFDPAHAIFARSLLEQLRHLSKGTCSDDHAIEREAIWLALEHLDQILSRPKDTSGFDRMLASLVRIIGSCSNCCKLALDWVTDHKHALRNLILRCPTQKIRKDFSEMMMTALQYLRKCDPRFYGFDTDEIEHGPYESLLPETHGALQGLVSGLKDLWVTIHLNCRSWDDYFGLLAEIASLGDLEAHVVLREDFLRVCLEILLIEQPTARRMRNENPHYATIARLMEKGRKFSLAQLIELVRAMLAPINLELPAQALPNQDRPLINGKMMLTHTEDHYLHFGNDHRSRTLTFLDKILSSEQNSKAAKDIVRMMVLAEPACGYIHEISKTIMVGINTDPASLASPYLAAALTFCESSPATNYASQIITNVARDIDTIGQFGGKEHLEFFSQARRLQSLRISNQPHYFSRLVLTLVPMWAPSLIMYWEESVRLGTIELLKTLVFNRDIHNMDDEQEAELIERVARDLCQACVKRIQSQFVQEQKQVEVRSVDSIQLVIRHCLKTYYQVDIEEDHDIVAEAEAVLEGLQALTVADAEDPGSDEYNNFDSDMNTETSESENLTSP